MSMTDRTPASPVEVLRRFAADMARGVGVCEKPHRNGEAHPHIHYDDRYIAKARQLSGIASALQAQDHTITKGGLDVETVREVKRLIDEDPYPADAHVARRILAPVLAALEPTHD